MVRQREIGVFPEGEVRLTIKVNRDEVVAEESDLGRTWRFLRRDHPPGVGVGIAQFASLPEGVDPADRYEAHDVPEVHYVLSGRGILFEEGEEVALRVGDAVVTPPGIRHTLWSTGNEPLVTLYVAIQGTLFDG